MRHIAELLGCWLVRVFLAGAFTSAMIICFALAMVP